MDLYNVKDQSPEVRPVTVVVVRMRRREVAGSNIPGREVGGAGAGNWGSHGPDRPCSTPLDMDSKPNTMSLRNNQIDGSTARRVSYSLFNWFYIVHS